MQNFWEELKRPFFVLAPMEDVTNIVFRHVVAEAAPPDVYFTEFTNARSYNHPDGRMSVRGRLNFSEDEKPIVAHIWGDRVEDYEKMSVDMKKVGYSGLDINMGCPVKNVVKSNNGSGMARQPDHAAKLIQAAKTGGLPVSVKTRLGFAKIDEMYDWLPHVLEQDIQNLSIHLRTRNEMSNYNAHYEVIPAIKKMRDEIAPNTLLTINGDIANRQEGLQLIDEYGVDGIMIGRGIFHDPFAFEKEPREHEPKEYFDLFRLHLDLFDENQKIENAPFMPLKRFFKIYVRNIPGAAQLRKELMNTTSTDEARSLIDTFEKQI